MTPKQVRMLDGALRRIWAQLLSLGDQVDDALAALDDVACTLHQVQRTQEGEGSRPFVACDDFDLRSRRN